MSVGLREGPWGPTGGPQSPASLSTLPRASLGVSLRALPLTGNSLLPKTDSCLLAPDSPPETSRVSPHIRWGPP